MKEYRMIRIETALDVIRMLTPNKAIQYCLDIIDEELTLQACEFDDEEFTGKGQEELCKEQTIDDLRGIFSIHECYSVEAALQMMGAIGSIDQVANLTGIKSGLITRALNGQNVKAVPRMAGTITPDTTTTTT